MSTKVSKKVDSVVAKLSDFWAIDEQDLYIKQFWTKWRFCRLRREQCSNIP